jgi:hypothetical protein
MSVGAGAPTVLRRKCRALVAAGLGKPEALLTESAFVQHGSCALPAAKATAQLKDPVVDLRQPGLESPGKDGQGRVAASRGSRCRLSPASSASITASVLSAPGSGHLESRFTVASRQGPTGPEAPNLPIGCGVRHYAFNPCASSPRETRRCKAGASRPKQAERSTAESNRVKGTNSTGCDTDLYGIRRASGKSNVDKRAPGGRNLRAPMGPVV